MHSKQEIQDATLAAGRIMIQENMMKSQKWLERGILAIFARQTADEQNSENTTHDNRRGFNGSDAQFLSSLAKQILKRRNNKITAKFDVYRGSLSTKQTMTARRCMMKYARQLMLVVREKR